MRCYIVQLRFSDEIRKLLTITSFAKKKQIPVTLIAEENFHIPEIALKIASVLSATTDF